MMFRFLLLIALFVSLYWIFAPPAFLGTHKRRNALIAALAFGFARFFVFSPGEPDLAKKIEETTVVPTPKLTEATVAPAASAEAKTASPKISGPVIAMLGKQSLFTTIRRTGNVYCAADGPLWIVAELDDDFVAINGNARSWAQNGNLSVYRGNTWIKVKDKDLEASPSQMADTRKLLQTGLALCPQENIKSVAEEGVKRIDEGKKRYTEIGSVYGLFVEKGAAAPKKDPVVEGPMGRKAVVTNGFGCEDDDRFKRILKLHGSGDSQAAQRLLTTSLLAKQCVGFNRGDTVFVEDISVWSNTRCVRPVGETICYWTTKNLVEKSE